jgi:hypothetical protein
MITAANKNRSTALSRSTSPLSASRSQAARASGPTKPARTSMVGRTMVLRRRPLMRSSMVLRICRYSRVEISRWSHMSFSSAAAMKCVYLAIMSLDPTGKGQQRWSNRWKTALNAFEITFDG